MRGLLTVFVVMLSRVLGEGVEGTNETFYIEPCDAREKHQDMMNRRDVRYKEPDEKQRHHKTCRETVREPQVVVEHPEKEAGDDRGADDG